MGFEDMLDQTCDIYHIVKEEKSPGYNLKGSPSFSYPEQPDEPGVACHFHIKNGTVTVTQGEPQRRYDARVKLSLPADTDIRVNDKIIDCGSGYEYTAGIPRGPRGHHMIVWLYRTSDQAPL